MLRTPDRTVHYLPLGRDVSLPNPHIGFQSFQRFRGDRLIPDSVEGWEKEFLPDRAGILRTPWEPFPHPDPLIAYFRVCWKDFEPDEGEYRFDLIEGLLAEASRQGQTVMLRLMPHTTRPNQDVPDWLKARIPTPERPAAARVKDSPNHPEFFRAFARAVEALGDRFDGDERLEAVDIALCGAWGEGHRIETFPPEDIQTVLDAYLHAFPRTILLGQINCPQLNLAASERRPVGFRCDCLGDMNHHMIQFYPRAIAQMNELWKRAPVAFESGWTMVHWQEMGWDLDYIIEQSLKWHISCFNAKSGRVPAEWTETVRLWCCRMGYRLSPRFVDYPAQARPGDTLHLGLWIENSGVAPLYRAYPMVFRLLGARRCVSLVSNASACGWLPGDSVFTCALQLPDSLPQGHYRFQFALCHPQTLLPAVRWASLGTQPDGFLEAGSIEITE